MKRSKINESIKKMEAMIAEYKFALPPFLNWTPEEWLSKGHDYDEIRDCMLGWDVTDYGMGNFEELGIALITLRNGKLNDKTYNKPYAEKLIFAEEGQVSPMHFHWNKQEDIINRGGGNLVFKLFNADENEKLADTDVHLLQDGRRYTVKAGSEVILKPGESLTFYPYLYHEFTVQPGTGPVLLGEVSMVNDDTTDNRFEVELGRFPTIEEDEAPYRLLCTEYPKAN